MNANQIEIIDLEPRQVYVRKPRDVVRREEPRQEEASAKLGIMTDMTIAGIKMPILAWICVVAFGIGFVIAAPLLVAFIILVVAIAKQRGAKKQ